MLFVFSDFSRLLFLFLVVFSSIHSCFELEVPFQCSYSLVVLFGARAVLVPCGAHSAAVRDDCMGKSVDGTDIRLVQSPLQLGTLGMMG